MKHPNYRDDPVDESMVPIWAACGIAIVIFASLLGWSLS